MLHLQLTLSFSAMNLSKSQLPLISSIYLSIYNIPCHESKTNLDIFRSLTFPYLCIFSHSLSLLFPNMAGGVSLCFFKFDSYSLSPSLSLLWIFQIPFLSFFHSFYFKFSKFQLLSFSVYLQCFNSQLTLSLSSSSKFLMFQHPQLSKSWVPLSLSLFLFSSKIFPSWLPPVFSNPSTNFLSLSPPPPLSMFKVQYVLPSFSRISSKTSGPLAFTPFSIFSGFKSLCSPSLKLSKDQLFNWINVVFVT